MGTVSVHEAKTQLSRLLRRVMTGEEIIIERRGEPVAKLVRIEPAKRVFGTNDGFPFDEKAFKEADEEILRTFEEAIDEDPL